MVGWLSVWPRFQLIEAGQAMISLSFSHAGQRIRECRKLTQQELNALPPNMRKPEDCPRERRPVQVVFRSNDTVLYAANRRPTGIWGDGAANVYRRLSVEAGTQRLFIGMNDSGAQNGDTLGEEFDYSAQQTVELAPGQHLVVEFDDLQKSFVFRQD
jgi:hypothetical protein